MRSAAKRVKVSHQTCYRARRNSAAFGRAWDAALVVARGSAEAKLADCAIDGVREEVWYHGELVGERTRFSERLLLAHLGRLDRMRSDARIDALAEDFGAMLRRMRAGEPIDVEVNEAHGSAHPAPASPNTAHPEPASINTAHPEPVERGWSGSATLRQAQGERAGVRTPKFSSPGQCNTRSMSPGGEVPDVRAEPPCDCPGTRHGFDGGRTHYSNGPDGPEPVINLDGSGPCCDRPRWPGCAECPHYSPVSRELNAMRDDRPADAPRIDEMGGDPLEIEQCQLTAFRSGALPDGGPARRPAWTARLVADAG
ncbi:hypothetical protein [Qipengyuania qiaonensis]|uniref:Uncharacterized protein n=1 Tax=Qipengyuania qiaonensis TaxID=2867240 RepID=A0ABS7J4V3_9SPHN|nr:hypothetical protein [Qipengyuania qiaonensis]MBX7480899.1 hypothetical protein [Qipengyuania qiaonensis]